MKREFLLMLLTWLCMTANVMASSNARSFMRRGLESYRKGQFSEARTLFADAANRADEQNLEPVIALFNKGNALYRMGEWQEAAAAYEQARMSLDIELQAASLFNLGNTSMQEADMSLTARDGAAAMESLERAMAAYEQAMLLDPEGRDIKVNWELAAQGRRALKGNVKRVVDAIAKAHDQVEERDYERAMETLIAVYADLDLAFSLNPELESRYMQLQQRIEDILEIQRLDELPLSDLTIE